MDREEIDRRLLQATCQLAVATMYLIKATKEYFKTYSTVPVKICVEGHRRRQGKPEDVAADTIDEEGHHGLFMKRRLPEKKNM